MTNYRRLRFPPPPEGRGFQRKILMSALLCLMLWLVSLQSFADNQTQMFQQTVSEYRKANQSIDRIVQQKKLNKLLPGYTQNITEKNLYGDSTQTSDDLTTQGLEVASNNDTTKAVLEGFSQRPIVKINTHDPAIQNSQSLETNADSFLDGDVETQTCTVVNTEKTCTESVRALHQVCTKTPMVEIEEKPVERNQSFSGNIHAQTNTSGTLTLSFDGIITQFSVTLKSNNVWLCHRTYQGKLSNILISQMQGNCGHYLGDLQFSNHHLSIPIKKNTPITFQLVGAAWGKWSRASYQLTVTVQDTQKTTHITWKEGCHDV